MAGLQGKYDFSRTRSVLAEMKNLLRCSICKGVAVNPLTLGQCTHFFCSDCVATYKGGGCPAFGCPALAPPSAFRPHKTIHSFTKSVFSIGKLLGEEIPDKMKRHMSTEVEEEEGETEKFMDTVMDEEEKTVAPANKLQPPPENLKPGSKTSAMVSTNDSENDSPKIARRIRTPKPQGRTYASEYDFDNFEPENFKTPDMPGPGRKSRTAKTPVSRCSPATAGSGQTPGSCSVSAAETTGAAAAVGNAGRSAARTPQPGRGKRARAGLSPGPDNSTEAVTSSVWRTPGSRGRTPSAARSSERKKPSSLEKKNKKGETLLHNAAVKGDLATVRSLLQRGADPNTLDHAGWSPLHEVSIAGRADLVELLLDAGANPCLHATTENLTPLHDAVSNGHIEVIRLLVSRGADINAKNLLGHTPLSLAAASDTLTSVLTDTPVEVSPSQINQPVEQDTLPADKIVISCPEASSDSEFKKICAAASKLKIRKPSRAISEATTHCLLDNCSNANNVLAAQLVGAEILRSEWILQSRQIGQVADTEPFLFLPPELTLEGRQRSRDCRRRAQPRLFTGLHFFLAGGYDQTRVSKADLQRLINLSGGIYISREPDPENLGGEAGTVPHHAQDGSPLGRTSHIILYQEGGKREPQVKYKMEHIKTLPLTWFIQSILQHRLLSPDLYVL